MGTNGIGCTEWERDFDPKTEQPYRAEIEDGAMSRIRCINGRLFRHDPQRDDPDLETDIGKCPDCSGKGCDDPSDEVGTVAQAMCEAQTVDTYVIEKGKLITRRWDLIGDYGHRYWRRNAEAAIAALDASRARDKGGAKRAPRSRMLQTHRLAPKETVGFRKTACGIACWPTNSSVEFTTTDGCIIDASDDYSAGLITCRRCLGAALRNPPAETIAPAPSQSDAIRAEVIAQGVDPNSDKAERMGRAARQNMRGD